MSWRSTDTLVSVTVLFLPKLPCFTHFTHLRNYTSFQTVDESLFVLIASLTFIILFAPSHLLEWFNILVSAAEMASADRTTTTGPMFYAEYLPNIKSVNVTLTACLPGSSFGISLSGTELCITAPSGEAHQVPLPERCNISGMRIMQDPQQTVVRLSADPLDTSSSKLLAIRRELCGGGDAIIPWSAIDLTGTDVKCGTCSSQLMRPNTIETWKDLPSEGWAEMMDLWHCHKPDTLDHEHDSEATAVHRKGYSAGNKLLARQGVGFVDSLTFLLREEDCLGLIVSLHFPPSWSSLLFFQAHIPLGFVFPCHPPSLPECFSPTVSS